MQLCVRKQVAPLSWNALACCAPGPSLTARQRTVFNSMELRRRKVGAQPIYTFLFHGAHACLDFTVTNGLRIDHLRSSARDASAAVLAYLAHKCAYLHTHAQCRSEGMAFIPMVMEGHRGSWGTEVAKF